MQKHIKELMDKDYEEFVTALIKLEYVYLTDDDLQGIYSRYLKSDENLLGISNIVEGMNLED